MTKEDKLALWLSLTEKAREEITANQENFKLLIERFGLVVDKSPEIALKGAKRKRFHKTKKQ